MLLLLEIGMHSHFIVAMEMGVESILKVKETPYNNFLELRVKIFKRCMKSKLLGSRWMEAMTK